MVDKYPTPEKQAAAAAALAEIEKKLTRTGLRSIACHLAAVLCIVFAGVTHHPAWWVAVGFTYLIAWRASIGAGNVGGAVVTLKKLHTDRCR